MATRADTEWRYEKLTWPEINDAVDLGVYPGGGAFNAPTSGKGQISMYQSNPGMCMELHNGNLIVVAPCLGRASEEWNVIVSSVTFGHTTLQSYIYKSAYNSSLCLAGPVGNKTGQLVAAPCNYSNLNQNWFFQSP